MGFGVGSFRWFIGVYSGLFCWFFFLATDETRMFVCGFLGLVRSGGSSVFILGWFVSSVFWGHFKLYYNLIIRQQVSSIITHCHSLKLDYNFGL